MHSYQFHCSAMQAQIEESHKRNCTWNILSLSRVWNFCHDCKWKSGGNSWLPETRCQLFQVSGETNLKFRAESFSTMASHDSLSEVSPSKAGEKWLPINGCMLGRYTFHFEPFIAFTVQKFNTIFQSHFHYWWKEWYCQIFKRIFTIKISILGLNL